MAKIETMWGYKLSWKDILNSKEKIKEEILNEFVYQSNLIEGINIDCVETINVGEKLKPYPELRDHYVALHYVLDNMVRNPKQKDILNIHKLLMKNLIKDSGEYRKCPAYVGSIINGFQGVLNHEQIHNAIELLENKIQKIENNSLKKIKKSDKQIESKYLWDIHDEFETIHPFSDGNGRTGRLLLNWLSIRYLDEFYVVENRKKQHYYEQIKQYRDAFKKQNPEFKFYKNIPPNKEQPYKNLVDSLWK